MKHLKQQIVCFKLTRVFHEDGLTDARLDQPRPWCGATSSCLIPCLKEET